MIHKTVGYPTEVRVAYDTIARRLRIQINGRSVDTFRVDPDYSTQYPLTWEENDTRCSFDTFLARAARLGVGRQGLANFLSEILPGWLHYD